MMSSNKTVRTAAVALAFILMTTGHAAARESNSANQPQEARANPRVQAVPTGQELKTIGIVTKRNADSFILREQTGAERDVLLAPGTDVRTHKQGVFRGGKEYGVSYILRGLRLEVSGRGNEQGQLVAEKIRFDEDDLRTAQALEVRVDPVEEEAQRQARELEEIVAALPPSLASSISPWRSISSPACSGRSLWRFTFSFIRPSNALPGLTPPSAPFLARSRP